MKHKITALGVAALMAITLAAPAMAEEVDPTAPAEVTQDVVLDQAQVAEPVVEPAPEPVIEPDPVPEPEPVVEVTAPEPEPAVNSPPVVEQPQVLAASIQPQTFGGSHKITLCHANNGNGWVEQTVDTSSVTKKNGHDKHQDGRDIIPAFSTVLGSYAGKNLDTRYEGWATGAAILANGCQMPEQYVTVLWQMDILPESTSGVGWPQSYVDHEVTSTPNLAFFDDRLTGDCVGYQVDVYKYTTQADRAKVDFLIANGSLIGPGKPPEPLIPGGAGTAWKTYVNLDCTPSPIPECTTTGSYVLDAADFVDSDTRATGHYRFTDDGLDIWTEGSTSTDKVALYWAVGKPLTDIGQPSIDGNGTTDGILVGESVYGDNWWLSNSAATFVKDHAPHTGGGNGSPWYGTLAEWRAAFPDNEVVLGGFSLGSGVYASGTIHSVTMGCVEYTFQAPPKPRVCETFEANLSTNLDTNGWTIPSGARYVEGGIEIAVPRNWDEVAIQRSFVGALADIGTGVDITASPIQYVGIHITTSKGVLVYEEEPSYGGKWWSTSDFGVASGMGYATFDTLENIVAANPDVTTSVLRVLYTSPTPSKTTITEVKVGCTVFTFDYAEKPDPPVKPPVVVPAGGAVPVVAQPRFTG